MDGLPGAEGTFLACSFWLADALQLAGRRKDALVLFERLLALRNDVGPLAEEYDPATGRQLGNFPQAFSRIGLVGDRPHPRGTAQGRLTPWILDSKTGCTSSPGPPAGWGSRPPVS